MTKNDSTIPTQKILARSLDEAKEKLYKLFQSDYEIVNLRQVLRGGLFGFGQHEEIEVSYRVKPRGFSSDFHKKSANPEMSRGANLLSNTEDSFLKNKNEILQKNGLTEKLITNIQINNIEKKIESLTRTLQEQTVSVATANISEHPNIVKIQNLLENNEFSLKYIRFITEKIKKNFSLDALDDFKSLQIAVVDWIGETISISKQKVHRKPIVTIIVGPTGVGKTTTLVKLATQYTLSTERNTGVRPHIQFLTTDSMRVGAIEQLQRFGSIFDCDVIKAENASDLKQVFESLKDSVDAIYIDTSGFSPNDATHIGAMKETLSIPGMNAEVYLAMTASTKASDLINIMQNYEPFGYSSVIITKCDESAHYGNLISVMHEKNKSVSYITDGQKAARNINRAGIVEALIRLEGFEIDRAHIDEKFGEH